MSGLSGQLSSTGKTVARKGTTSMTFKTHTTFSITAEGIIERGCSDLPSAVRLPAVSVTVAPDASAQSTARLLRRLADEIEGQL